MTNGNRPVGIREVADHAGVSVGTVSYTLNNPARVAEATRARVRASMDELGFVRNDVARHLRTGAATTVGMIVLDIANPFFASLAHACEMVAERAGLTVVLGSSDQDLAREDRYLELFQEQRVRAVLVAPINGTTQRMRDVAARGVPLVSFTPYADRDDEICSVALDGRVAGELGIAHLAANGRQRIALVGGPYQQVRDRWDGAVTEATRRGLTVQVIDTHGQTVEEGTRVGAQIASAAPSTRPDALFAANDLMALGLMQALTTAGVKIPDQVALLGVDGTSFAASAAIPLSTLAQPIDELAATAFGFLLDPSSAASDRHRLVTPTLLVRRSTAA